MNPNDPIAQSIDYDISEGLTDPSRAAMILKMLPAIVGSKPEVRPIGDYSGLPQTGTQALADIGSLAGQGPSGVGQDVRMGTNLSDIYRGRAELAQRADIFSNEEALRRSAEENQLTRARATQAMDALKFVQQDRQIAEQIKVNNRLLATDARMRIEFIGEQAKAAGAPDSPEYRAYMDTFMRALRDPARRAALLHPQTGVETMTSIMDESLQASRRPGEQPATPSPRANAVLGVVQGRDFPTVAPTEQMARDALRGEVLAGEQAGTIRYDPIVSAPQKPAYPPAPTRAQGEGNAAFEKRKSEHAKIVTDMTKEYQADVARYNEGLIKQREDRAKAEKERISATEAAVDAKRIRDSATDTFSSAIKTAQDLAKHKGLPRIVGPMAGTMPNLFGDARDAQAIYDYVTGGAVMEKLNELKSQSKTGATGFGALSEGELKLLKAAASKLDQKQTETQFRDHLAEYIAKLTELRRRVDEDYKAGPWAKSALPGGVTVTVE